MKKLLSVGIDVSKDTLDVCLLSKDNSRNLQVTNNRKGMNSLKQKLQEIDSIPIVIEATGGYHYDITFFLQEKGFQVFVINPLITKRYLQSSIRKVKTDKADALILARIGVNEALSLYTETKLEVLRKKKVRLLHFYQKKSQEISTKISNSKNVGLFDSIELESLQRIKKSYQQEILHVKKELVKSLELIPQKIRGVSEVNHKAIAIELGNLKRFSNKRQIVAFAGLDPSIKESGTSVKGRSRLSKRGSKTLRHFLYQSAWGVMMHNPKYKKFYDKKRTEGKHYFTCLSAVARKLLCQIYFELKEDYIKG